MDRLTKAQMEFMNGYVPATIHDIYEYAAGGGIHIKESKKGTFTAAAKKHGKSVQAFASQVLANKDNYSSAMVKKANFARNAAKWHHEEGGVAQGDQGNAQMMQMIQMYAQMVAQQSGDDPNKVYQNLMQQLQQMKPEQQAQAIQQISSAVQSASQQQQQPAMQMGGDPSQMQQAPQQQGGDEQKLIQQVQQMLQQGAQPQDVIAQLLQLDIQPQMIVDIFVQLGMPQDQVVQAVQSVMQQMSGGQEEENPQEQMQEQNIEEPGQEPAQQGMKYGGIAKYPYGGMYADKKYYGDFLPQDALNNVMTDVNMLAMPAAALSATGIKPLKQIAGIASLASGLAGAFQGYRGAANAVFGKKDPASTPQNPITNAQATGVYNAYGKPGAGTEASDMWNKYGKTQKMYGQYMQDGGTPNNPGFNALPDYVQEKIIANMQYGGLPQAQFGFNYDDPFGMQSPRFGQTANYADTRGYTNGQPIRNRSTSAYSTPGFVEGMGAGQEGYGGADNTRYNRNDPNAPTAASMKLYNDQQALGAAGQNTISLTDEQVANKKGKYDGYAFPQYAPKTIDKKVNKKTANNVSGRQMANNALLGLSIFNDSLGERGPKAMSKAQVNQQREASMLYNPLNTTGVYTSNVQGGGNDYIPNRYTATQDYGTQGNIAKAGGQMNFAAGGQYKVSHDQLLQLLRDGAEIEFL